MLQRSCAALVLAFAALVAANARAYETDQFNNRLAQLRDAGPAMDAHVNAAIADAVAHCHGARDELKLVNKVYFRLGGLHWVDHIEKWAMQSPDIDKLQTGRFKSIYRGHPWYATRVTAAFGIGATFRLDGVLVGSDKLGHFFSQGRKFWLRWTASGDEAQAAKRSAATERGLFGQATTGDYSNADLVANYEGHRFYRSLFEDDVIPGKKAIVRWDGKRWQVQRAFAWSDHVNPWWDEALLVNDFDSILKPYMRERFLTFCPDYARDPAAWSVAPAVDEELFRKYAMLQLRDTRDMRLSSLCVAASTTAAASK